MYNNIAALGEHLGKSMWYWSKSAAIIARRSHKTATITAKKQVCCSEEGLIIFLFGIEVVGERDADVVVQRVLPFAGLLIGRLVLRVCFFHTQVIILPKSIVKEQIIPL